MFLEYSIKILTKTQRFVVFPVAHLMTLLGPLDKLIYRQQTVPFYVCRL